MPDMLVSENASPFLPLLKYISEWLISYVFTKRLGEIVKNYHPRFHTNNHYKELATSTA